MNYQIEKHAGESAYLQLYRQLRRDILEGVLPEGARLPSKRMLAMELGVSVITVEHAFALLVDEGCVEARPRSGFYVCYGGRAAPALPRAALEDMSAAAAGPEDFPFSVLARTMRGVLADYDRRILVKSPNAGCLELRRAIADYLRRSRGLSVRPEQILIGSGAEYLYGLVVQLLGRDRGYALEDPGYEKIRLVYEAHGAVCEALPLEEDGIDSAALASSRAGVLHVTPFHSYPSGITASAAKRQAYIDWARDRDGLIVEDDYDSELATLSPRIETLYSLAPERVLYLSTFSKLLAPAMRTGFLVLPEPLLEDYARRLDFYSCTVPIYDQYVLAEFIRAGHMERYINRRRRRMRQQSKQNGG